jgi:hypothetical protein
MMIEEAGDVLSRWPPMASSSCGAPPPGTWGFTIYRASHDDYRDNFLPSGQPAGAPEEALDRACGLYFGDPTARLTLPGTATPADYGQEHQAGR